MSRVWRDQENLRVSFYVTFSKAQCAFNIPNPKLGFKMIGMLVSIFALIAAVSVAYLLMIIDSIVHHQLYEFGLEFSYDWANPYWMFLRTSLALLGLIAVASSMNITYLFWKKLRKPELAKPVEEATKAEEVLVREGEPSLFQCTSCRRSITHPLRMLDFHSQSPKVINVCPFCNAMVVAVSYARSKGEVTTAEEEQEKIN